MFAAFQPDAAHLLLRQSALLLALLFLTPVAGGVAAFLALRSRPRQLTTAVSDGLWRALVATGLIAYLWFLLLLPAGDNKRLEYALIMLLTSYWMGATALSVVVLPMWGRLALFGVVFILLATLPVRSGFPWSPLEVVNVLYVFCFNLPLLLGLSWVYARADDADTASDSVRTSHLLLAETQAKVAARRRADEFTHNHVLSVLNAVALHHENGDSLRTAAQDALSAIGNATPSESMNVRDISSALLERFPQIEVYLDHSAENFDLDNVGPVLFNAALESVDNALRHGQTIDGAQPNVYVSMTTDGPTLRLVVQDTGRGFSTSTSVGRGRFGVRQGIIGGVEEIGGQVAISSTPNKGTTVTIEWPGSEVSETAAERALARRRWLSDIGNSMDTSSARFLVATLFVAHAVIVALIAPWLTSVGLSVAALCLYLLVAIALLIRGRGRGGGGAGGRLPARIAILIVGLGAGANYLALIPVPLLPDIGDFTWSLGMTGLVACGLLVRGRPGYAWLLLCFLLLTTLPWGLQVGLPLPVVAAMTAGQVVLLSFWSLIVVWSTRTVGNLAQLDKERLLTHREQLILDQTARQMNWTRSRLRKVVTPVLEPIAHGLPLLPAQRTEAALLEAELRDSIRAPSFTGTQVAVAAREARQRGVEVVLLDDMAPEYWRGRLPEKMQQKAIEALNEARERRVVIRLFRPRQQAIGTIYSEGVLTTIEN